MEESEFLDVIRIQDRYHVRNEFGAVPSTYCSWINSMNINSSSQSTVATDKWCSNSTTSPSIVSNSRYSRIGIGSIGSISSINSTASYQLLVSTDAAALALAVAAVA